MITLMMLGFLIGMRHALEGDHLAAVASLATHSPSLRHALKIGATWGLGHTITLFLFGSIVIWMDAVIPEQLARWLEFVVGLMLVVLGVDVIRRVIRDRLHYHVHRHDDGAVHFHAHTHARAQVHNPRHHEHNHPCGIPVRALLVGLVHGMAGSAALILLTLQTLDSPWSGMLYMALFGIGSMAGMATISTVIAVPLRASSMRLTWLHNGLQLSVGLFTTFSGAWVAASIALPQLTTGS